MPLDEEEYGEALMRVHEIDNDLTELEAQGAREAPSLRATFEAIRQPLKPVDDEQGDPQPPDVSADEPTDRRRRLEQLGKEVAAAQRRRLA